MGHGSPALRLCSPTTPHSRRAYLFYTTLCPPPLILLCQRPSKRPFQVGAMSGFPVPYGSGPGANGNRQLQRRQSGDFRGSGAPTPAPYRPHGNGPVPVPPANMNTRNPMMGGQNGRGPFDGPRSPPNNKSRHTQSLTAISHFILIISEQIHHTSLASSSNKMLVRQAKHALSFIRPNRRPKRHHVNTLQRWVWTYSSTLVHSG